MNNFDFYIHNLNNVLLHLLNFQISNSRLSDTNSPPDRLPPQRNDQSLQFDLNDSQ